MDRRGQAIFWIAIAGANPEGNLVVANRRAIYGTTSKGGQGGFGTAYQGDPGNGGERQLYSFKGGAGGSTPTGGLIKKGGLFYGTTSAGGQFGLGTVFGLAR